MGFSQAEVIPTGEFSNSGRDCRWRVQRKVCTERRKEGKNDHALAGKMITGRNQSPVRDIPPSLAQILLFLQEAS